MSETNSTYNPPTFLTDKQIAFGDESNLMTSSDELTFNGAIFNVSRSGDSYLMVNRGLGLFQAGSETRFTNGSILKMDDGTGIAYYDNTAHTGKFGVNTSAPTVALDVVGTVNISEVVKLLPTAYVDRPATPIFGMIICFNDSNTNTWGAIISGGGFNKVIAFYNNEDWTVMAA